MGYTSLKDLKSSSKEEFDALAQEIEKTQSKRNDRSDDRFFNPTVDKAGNGQALLRFLPAAPGESVPFVRYFNYDFNGVNGKFYAEKSLQTWAEADPVNDWYWKVFNFLQDHNPGALEAFKKAYNRRASYVSNVLVIEDPGNAENNGKVKLYRYGMKIWDKINSAMHPPFTTDKPYNPFNFWEGANFKLIIRTINKQRNYDACMFDRQSALFDSDDAKIDTIWKQEFKLQPFIDRTSAGSYAELKQKLDTTLGFDSSTGQYLPPQSRQSRQSQPQAASSPAASGHSDDMSVEDSYRRAVGDTEDANDVDELLDKLTA